MSQNETEKLLAMLDSMEEAIATNHWPSNDPAGTASIDGAAPAPAGPWGAQPDASGPAPVGPWGAPPPDAQPAWGPNPGQGPWDPTAGAAPDAAAGWDAGGAPAWNGEPAAAAAPPVPRPDAPPITAAFRNHPDPVPSREGYTPTRGKTSEVLSSIQWVPES